MTASQTKPVIIQHASRMPHFHCPVLRILPIHGRLLSILLTTNLFTDSGKRMVIHLLTYPVTCMRCAINVLTKGETKQQTIYAHNFQVTFKTPGRQLRKSGHSIVTKEAAGTKQQSTNQSTNVITTA